METNRESTNEKGLTEDEYHKKISRSFMSRAVGGLVGTGLIALAAQQLALKYIPHSLPIPENYVEYQNNQKLIQELKDERDKLSKIESLAFKELTESARGKTGPEYWFLDEMRKDLVPPIVEEFEGAIAQEQANLTQMELQNPQLATYGQKNLEHQLLRNRVTMYGPLALIAAGGIASLWNYRRKRREFGSTNFRYDSSGETA